MGHTACESVSVIFLLKSPSSRIYWNSYWLPLQDKCKSHSLIFTIYQDAAAHFQQEISLTRTQTPLHLNSIFIVRHSLSSGRREKSCLSRGESWSKRGRWGEREGESKALLARHHGMTKSQMEGRKVGRWKIDYEYIKLRPKIFWNEKENGFTWVLGRPKRWSEQQMAQVYRWLVSCSAVSASSKWGPHVELQLWPRWAPRAARWFCKLS